MRPGAPRDCSVIAAPALAACSGRGGRRGHLRRLQLGGAGQSVLAAAARPAGAQPHGCVLPAGAGMHVAVHERGSPTAVCVPSRQGTSCGGTTLSAAQPGGMRVASRQNAPPLAPALSASDFDSIPAPCGCNRPGISLCAAHALLCRCPPPRSRSRTPLRCMKFTPPATTASPLQERWATAARCRPAGLPPFAMRRRLLAWCFSSPDRTGQDRAACLGEGVRTGPVMTVRACRWVGSSGLDYSRRRGAGLSVHPCCCMQVGREHAVLDFIWCSRHMPVRCEVLLRGHRHCFTGWYGLLARTGHVDCGPGCC